MLRRCLGEVPPIEGLATWEQALGDPQQLNLYFEVSLPTPKGYRKYLVDRLPRRVLVPCAPASRKHDQPAMVIASLTGCQEPLRLLELKTPLDIDVGYTELAFGKPLESGIQAGIRE
jgi:hypothetical protein